MMSRFQLPPCLAAIVCTGFSLAAEPAPLIDIRPLLARMEADGDAFEPMPLPDLGLPELSALLDHLMPESAGVGCHNPGLDERIATLVTQLGDERYAVREAASRCLPACGVPARKPLTRALEHPDPEVRQRAAGTLKTLGLPDRERDLEMSRRYGEAYEQILQGVCDRASLQLLARRVTAALLAGRDYDFFASTAVARLAESRDDGVVDLLIPLLKSDQTPLVVATTNMVGGRSPRDYCPNYLMGALEHPHPQVLHEAVTWILPCPDRDRLDAIEALARRRITDSDPAIRLEAAALLFRQWGNEEAIDLLIGLAHDPTGVNIATVLRRLAHPSHSKPAIHREILRRLATIPITHNEDGANWLAVNLKDIRGEAAARLVIGCLGFDRKGILDSVRDHLDIQNDPTMCRRVLADIAKNHPNPATRNEAEALLWGFQRPRAKGS